MAIDVCSEISSSGISPRISFSHDLKNSDGEIQVEENRHRKSDLCLVDSKNDFVFCITNGLLSHQISSADELFSNGRIVPSQIKRFSNVPRETLQPSGSSTRCKEKKRLKEFLSASPDAENEEKRPSFSKGFWQFKRSNSLNSETPRGKSLIRSLQFLSRSYSTGSAPNPKETEAPKETKKQSFQRKSSVSSRRFSTSSSSGTSGSYYFYESSQKPSLKKSCGSSSGYYGLRISPVLNLPQAYIPKTTASFLGFGSLFCNGRFKKKKN